MESWRIKTYLTDNTERASVGSAIIGATVIKSPKGPKNFTRFYRGDVKKILDTFGYPSKDYPSIQDALDIISKSDMYIASPYKNGKFGGVFVTTEGTVSFVNGVSEKEISDYSDIDCEHTVGIGDSINITYDVVLPNIKNYKKNTINLKIGDTSVTIESTEEGDSEVFSENDTISSGSLNLSTGELTITFKSAPTEPIVATYKSDMSNTIFTIFNKDMQKDDLRVKVVKNRYDEKLFNIYVERYNEIDKEFVELSNSPFVVGLEETSKDTEGNDVYISSVFDDNQLLFDVSINNSIFESFTSDTNYVKLNGGNRGDEIDESDIANTYRDLEDSESYGIKFAFDGNGSQDIVSVFEDLRKNYHKRCRFLYCSQNKTAEEIINEPSLAHFDAVDRGLYCYCLTWGIHVNSFMGANFLCSNMGLIAGKIVDMLRQGWGEPMWLDSNGVGGQLGSSITKLSQKAKQTQLEQLADNFINPIVNNKTYGIFIENASTRQTKLSVLSDIGISSLVDSILEDIETSVLPQRIGKLIDEDAYANVRDGCESILRGYSQALEDWFVLCDSTNNTDETRNQETLKVSVGIIPKKYAKKIILNLSLYKSGVNVQEEVSNL